MQTLPVSLLCLYDARYAAIAASAWLMCQVVLVLLALHAGAISEREAIRALLSVIGVELDSDPPDQA